MKIKYFMKKIIYRFSLLHFFYRKIIDCIKRDRIKIRNFGFGKIKADCIGSDNEMFVGSGTCVECLSVRIRGNNNKISIGENCGIGKNCSLWLEGNNVEIKIGDNCTFTQIVHLCAQENGSRIFIGNDCMLSNNIIIRTSDSHPIYNGEGSRINPAGNILIGDHVWIAPNVKVFKGVTIGEGSIIGSDTLVTHSISQNVLAVGHPAKVVKENIRWTRETLF